MCFVVFVCYQSLLADSKHLSVKNVLKVRNQEGA